MTEQAIVDSFHQLHEGSLEADIQPPSGQALSDFAFVLSKHGVMQTVLLQPRPSFEQTELALSLAAKTDWIGAVVGWVDLKDPRAEKALEHCSANPKFRGVCHPVDQEPENGWLLREDVLSGLRAVGARGLSLDLLVEPQHLPSVAELAIRLPGLRMVIDHLGSPYIARGIREPWGVYMLNIARHSNVWCKVSGLVTRDVQPGWHLSHIKGFVEAAVRLFGYDRLMFGSDWPTHTNVADYGQVIETALTAAGPFTPAQKERFLRGSATEFYRLG